MKKLLLLMVSIPAALAVCIAQHPGYASLPTARFSIGDTVDWKAGDYDDRQWKAIQTGTVWQAQGYPNYHGYAWYRIHVVIPSSLKSSGRWKDSLRIFLAHVNDVDETWLNGQKIGQTGSFPGDPAGYVSKWPAVREYHVAVADPAIAWDRDNVIAVRVYDGGGTGGIFMGDPYLDMLEKTDGISVRMVTSDIKYGKSTAVPYTIRNAFNVTVDDLFTCRVYDESTHGLRSEKKEFLHLGAFEEKRLTIDVPSGEGIVCEYTFGDGAKGRQSIPYILTPVAGLLPKINSPKVAGVRPGSPFLFKIAATGKAPLSYAVAGLPAGWTLDGSKGVISGKAGEKGDVNLLITVSNPVGKAKGGLRIKIGDTLAFTPPMGWNSWNCWGLTVSDEKVRSSAQAMIDKGLIDHGWSYINIDDGWQDPVRTPEGGIVPNAKFPAMKVLGDWLHGKGLKFGIYSSPGPYTCGGFIGSWQHEQADADSYAVWGVDYLKYDWCSYDGIVGSDTSLAAYIRPFRLMEAALRKEPRDIVYNLCQYGMKDVWKWGGSVGAQSWRTTEDIEDTWESLYHIGFGQDSLYPYSRPGNWNDPDMMILGQVGWGEELHPTRLTPDEQYTHVSLWSLLAAPLLIGCDMAKLDPFSLSLLTNDEVLAIDQDVAGKQARRVIRGDHYQVWIRELADGACAMGIFNMDTVYRKISIKAADLVLESGMHLSPAAEMRDVWRQCGLGRSGGEYTVSIPPHGVRLIRIK